MSEFQAKGAEQERIVASAANLLVVLGGAGTGKTTSALAAAGAHLSRTGNRRHERVLFLSFSRAAVARIEDRASGALTTHRERVDVSTFHALAFSIVHRFGSVIGHPTVRLVPPARQLLANDSEAIGYADLMPMALRILQAAPAARLHVRRRWGLIIVDEYQDTDDSQVALLDELAIDARRILLGDPDQCIYSFRARDGVRVKRILDAAREAGPEGTINLPEVSHRDPSQLVPAVARAIQRRDFASPVLTEAKEQGRLVILDRVRLEDEVRAVKDAVHAIQEDGLGVAIFTHHNDMLAALSDGLKREGIEHEIAGLSDALACALEAQSSMVSFAVGEYKWEDVLLDLAVFVVSAQRGRAIPELAHQLKAGGGTSLLGRRLDGVKTALSAATIDEAPQIASEAHASIGLPSKSSAWSDASLIVQNLALRSRRLAYVATTPGIMAGFIRSEAREVAQRSLTDMMTKPGQVQLMNLYQTKGREADATLIVLRENDWFGDEGEPWAETSRLLYVVFSRARQRIVLLPVGAMLHPAVRPLGLL